METKSLNYQYLSKYFIKLPYLLVLILCFGIYLLSDMELSMREEIAYVNNLNHLLSQTTTTKNAELVTEQIKYISNSMPEIEDISFFPSQTKSTENPHLSTYNVFFGTYHTLHEPVMLQTDTQNLEATPNMQLIGYINTTINLKYIRKIWFKRNIPLFFMIMLASLVSLMFMLKFLKRATKQLPLLEELSKKILSDEKIDEQNYQRTNDKRAVWLYEQALFHLLANQKKQQYRLEKVSHELVITKDLLEKQIEQYSNFQSSLTHELKLSLDGIESGLKLLESQYISNEQKDAIELIDISTNDLNNRLNELIQLNRIEKGQIVSDLKQFNPSHLLNTIVENFQNYAQEKDILLLVKNYHADYILEGDLQKIELIISSLVENALKFTHQGKVVLSSYIQHLESNIRWSVQISDTGIGIEQSYFNQIFQPFFQINPNHRRSTLNTTVGLFLTQKFADLINADIEVESELDKGSTFHVHFLLKDWNNHTEQQVLQDKKIAIWHKNENIVNQAQRLINTGADIQRFKDSELLLDYLNNNLVDMLIITFKIPANDVSRLVKKLRNFEKNHYFRTLIVYYYTPQHLPSEEIEHLQSIGVDYLENIKSNEGLNTYIKRLMQYLG